MTEPTKINQLAIKKPYEEYCQLSSPLEKHHYLYRLHDNDPTLFYHLIHAHFTEMLPIIYTPTIGTAIEEYDPKVYQTSALVIPYSERQKIDEILNRWPHKEIDLMIVTDSEGILGIGDQGIGGANICVGKGMVYSLCADIHSNRILPIYLDVGTNNQKLFNDPNYSGWQHKRIDGKAYDDFIEVFVNAVKKKFPHAILHWEDFGKTHARDNLLRYRNTLPSFNDDIQGTGVVALACILSALKKTEQKLVDQRIVILGAGSAGTGIADQIAAAMKKEGLANPFEKLYLVGRHGLLTEKTALLDDAQKKYIKKGESLSLKETIKKIKPNILIGCSTASGAFDSDVIRMMAEFHEHPIIMPLSNPTRKAEATAEAIIKGSQGRALIATGSPFADVEFEGKVYSIAQCNNAYVFPGIGLGALNSNATSITDEMLLAASYALADFKHNGPALLPPLNELNNVTQHIAKAIAK